MRGVVVASAGQGPLGRPSDGSDEGDVKEKWASGKGGGQAMRSNAGGGEGEGSAGAAGVLATRSTGEVGISCVGDDSAWAEDGVGRAGSSLPICCNIVVFIAHTTSRIKLGESLAWLLG